MEIQNRRFGIRLKGIEVVLGWQNDQPTTRYAEVELSDERIKEIMKFVEEHKNAKKR